VEVKAPAILIHPSGVSLRHQGIEGVDFHSAYLCFKGPLERMWEGLRTREIPYLYVHRPDPELLDAVMTCVDQAFALSWKDAWTFVESISQLHQHLAPYASDFTQPVPPIVQRLQNAMLGNWSQPCSAGDAARKLGMSRSDFYRRFQVEAGCPPAEWIRNKRITIAQNHLEHGFSVTQVSDILHFSSPYAFSKTFKRVTGISPKTYQQANPGTAT
jgi:transcriptional regulator GlxA family with amidase domain